MHILFALLLTVDPTHGDHAIYLSTIHAESKEQQLVLNIRVFEDDIRDALRNMNGQVIDTSSAIFAHEIERYFNKHVVVKNRQEIMPISLITYNLVGDSYRVEMLIDNLDKEGQLEFQIDYLQELFPTQQNILQLKLTGKEWYHIFKLGKESWVVPNY